jgi:CheY-like chemotaxis protein
MKKSVLIVEDEEDILLLYANILKKEGFTVFTATNGREGLDMVKKKSPDIILLDILMPEMDGITTLRELRSAGSEAKVIILTASPILRLNEGVELGIHAYLNKAASTPKEIVHVVHQAAKSS